MGGVSEPAGVWSDVGSTGASKSFIQSHRQSLPVQELQTMVEGIPEFVAVVSCDGTILITNRLWDRELDARGSSDIRVGHSYSGSLAALAEAGDLRAKPLTGLASKRTGSAQWSASESLAWKSVSVNLEDAFPSTG